MLEIYDTNDAPKDFAISDIPSLATLSRQFATSSEGIVAGAYYVARLRLNSGRTAKVLLMIPDGAQQFSIGVGGTAWSEPVWYIAKMPPEAPASLRRTFSGLALTNK
jgi:hypothetical protein